MLFWRFFGPLALKKTFILEPFWDHFWGVQNGVVSRGLSGGSREAHCNLSVAIVPESCPKMDSFWSLFGGVLKMRKQSSRVGGSPSDALQRGSKREVQHEPQEKRHKIEVWAGPRGDSWPLSGSSLLFLGPILTPKWRQRRGGTVRAILDT